MKYRTPRPFWEAYLQLPRAIQTKARKAFKLFRKGAENPPHHPSLRIQKMRGHPDIWEGHITIDYVFTFHLEADPETGETICVFRRIGTHDIYRNAYALSSEWVVFVKAKASHLDSHRGESVPLTQRTPRDSLRTAEEDTFGSCSAALCDFSADSALKCALS